MNENCLIYTGKFCEKFAAFSSAFGAYHFAQCLCSFYMLIA
jgi:hypothetical protein